MAKYKVAITKRGVTTELTPTEHYSNALNWANEAKVGAEVVVILRDDEGADHPENAGKFFLHTIIK